METVGGQVRRSRIEREHAPPLSKRLAHRVASVRDALEFARPSGFSRDGEIHQRHVARVPIRDDRCAIGELLIGGANELGITGLTTLVDGQVIGEQVPDRNCSPERDADEAGEQGHQPREGWRAHGSMDRVQADGGKRPDQDDDRDDETGDIPREIHDHRERARGRKHHQNG